MGKKKLAKENQFLKEKLKKQIALKKELKAKDINEKIELVQNILSTIGDFDIEIKSERCSIFFDSKIKTEYIFTLKTLL